MKKIIKKSLISFSIPFLTFVILQFLCILKGVSLLNKDNIPIFNINLFYIFFLACAVFLNLTSGRFDFSIGSVAILSSMIAGRIVITYNLNMILLILISILIGAVLGFMSGLAYILLGLSAIVLSLGIALIYEALSFIIYGGRGIVLIGRSDLLSIINFPNIYILGIIIFIFLYVLLNYTKFGYNYRALMLEPQIAVNSGINEKTNAVICFIIGGIMSSLAGLVSLSRTGVSQPSLSLSSIGTVFSGFLPVFIGVFISRYSELIIGIFLGSLTASLIATGLASLGVSYTEQNIVNAFILLIVLVITTNEQKFKEMILIKKIRKNLNTQ